MLLVDDDPLNLALMELILQKFEGEFETASNGREALEKLKSFRPDIVFLDVMMPEINGYEVCRKIKEGPHTKHIPVIMLTSFSDRESRLSGLEAGADDFISKPLLTTLHDVGNMEDGKMSLNYSPVDVSNLFRRVQDMFFSLAESEGKKILFEKPLSNKINADENLLERVLPNLVSNALRHVARGRGEVSFSLVEEDDRYVFSVSDNGSGILPEFHEKIFDKYGQTGVISDNPVSGMNKGLGLTFCKLVVEAHGGKIWVESDSGKGSIFRFTVLKR